MSEAREKLETIIPYLRSAMAEAKEGGRPQIGILSLNSEGKEGKVVARFDAAEFVDDLCDVLGLSKENTEDEELTVKADLLLMKMGLK